MYYKFKNLKIRLFINDLKIVFHQYSELFYIQVLLNLKIFF